MTAVGNGAGAVPSKRRYVPDETDKAFYKKVSPGVSFSQPYTLSSDGNHDDPYDWQLQSVTEKPHVDMYDPLRHLPPGKKADFSTLRSNIYEERIKPLRELVNRAKEGKPTSMDPNHNNNNNNEKGGQGTADVPRGNKKQRSMQQNIIVLSSSPTALVTMWNVKRLLEEGE